MLFISACVGRQAQWTPAGSQTALSSDQLEVDWPQGWMILRPAEKDEAAAKEGLLLIGTRDGISLQAVSLSKRALEAEFKHTQKKLAAGMLPQEAAEIILDDFRANPEIVDLKIVGNGPATIAGSPGFKLSLIYRSKSGLLRQTVRYGCLDKGILVSLSYNAPKQYYFSHDLATFEQMINSLRWKS
jgi:hypothetical protein